MDNNISCAILITGHMRNSLQDDLLKNILEKFKNSFNICDIFVHTWDTYEANSINPSHTLYDKKMQEQKLDTQKMIDYINPVKYIVEEQQELLLDDNEEYFFWCSVPRTSMKFIYYSILKAYELSKQNIIETGVKYNIVIRMRPDIYKFPYTADLKNIEHIVENIKKFKNKKNYLAGFLHFPDTVLGDNYFFLNYDDGDTYLKKINEDYSRICDENGCTSPETVVHICKNNLGLKSELATMKGSTTDLRLWAKKNGVTKRIICSMLDRIKNAIEHL
jgi:uncharacterized protein YlxP (DUF503 family)